MRDFYAGGHGRSAAMNRVEAARVHVVRKAARAADPGNNDKFFARNPELRENGMHGGNNRVISAAGEPADFRVLLKILLRKNRFTATGTIHFLLGVVRVLDQN